MLMVVVVVGDFMIVLCYFVYQFWVVFGDLVECEECSFDVMLIKYVEDQFDIMFDVVFVGFLFVVGNVGCEGGYLEIVFDVDGQGVGDCVYLCFFVLL